MSFLAMLKLVPRWLWLGLSVAYLRHHCRDAYLRERDNLQFTPEFRNRNEKV